MNKLITFDAETLYHEPQRRIKCFIEGLIPQGLNLICGAAKIGKSWLMLWLCNQIATGGTVWDRQTINVRYTSELQEKYEEVKRVWTARK